MCVQPEWFSNTSFESEKFDSLVHGKLIFNQIFNKMFNSKVNSLINNINNIT